MAHVVILQADKDGNIRLTKEQLQKMLDDAYDQGYEKGKNSTTSITYPSYPVWYQSTISNGKTISLDNIEITC